MPEQHLHIISFDVPYPSNYGGVIDVFYKLRALKNIGIKIHLHCFDYGRGKAEILNDLCFKVEYYPRKTGIQSNLSFTPYIVNSRTSEKLMASLLMDDFPILFEGLHTCAYLPDSRLKNRLKIYRESNIEHHYYMHLFRDEKSLFKKTFYLLEAFRLRLFQKKLRHADMMLVVSQSDTLYLQKHFPKNEIVYLPSFHPNDEFSVKAGKGDYLLYHGKLSVAENYNAATYLIKEIFAGTNFKFIIAGMDPPIHLKKLIEAHSNVTLISNPEDSEMFSLIQNAQANILITFQATGLKLKLLNTLYRGRFCIVNPAMVQGTGLESLCLTGSNSHNLKRLIPEVILKNFDENEVEKRKIILEKHYNNIANGNQLVGLIFR